MADKPVSTPRLTAEGLDCCATPESWEMLPEAQTPAQHLPNETSTDQEATTPHFGNDGMIDSFTGFMEYDMYETPPGAHLYRDQCAFDSFDMSCQDMDISGKAESSPNGTSCDGTTSEICPVPEDSPLEANKEESVAMIKESSLLKNEQILDEVTVNSEGQDSPYHNDSVDKCDKFGETDLQRSFDTIEKDNQQNGRHEVEDCILELLDRQEYPQEDGIAPIVVPALCHLPTDNEHLTSPKVESEQVLKQNIADISQAIPDYESAEDVCFTSEEKTEHCGDYLNSSAGCAGKESGMKDKRVEFQEEMDGQPQRSSSTPPENLNSSLMSLGAPQDAHELDQLADFLNMEDPFKRPRESLENLNPEHSCTSQPKDTDCEEPESIPVADEKIASPSTPPKRKKRGRKVNTVSERRRSVRIARRESLLNTPCDTGDALLHIEISNDISNTIPFYDQNTTQEPVNGGLELASRDQGRTGYESQYVPHPFPDVGESSPKTVTLRGNEKKNMESGLMESPTTLMAPNVAEEFEHSNIDLPMSRKKRKTQKERRKSVRLLKQDIRVDEGNAAFVQEPGVDEKKTMCDRGFLANFADFGLGDNWMPGDMFSESQFAKTPKKKSSRRKSARLSGVPITLLELKSKSEVKFLGGVEESSYRDGVDDYHFMEVSNVPDSASTVLAETTPVNNVSKDVQGSGYERIESLTEFPFERQDAVQSSKKKKESCSKRRRSVRLLKKPQEEPKYDTDPRQENQPVEPSKKVTKNKKKRKSVPGFRQGNVLQDVKITSCDNVSVEPEIKQEAFTVLKANVDNPPMDLGDPDDFRVSSEIMDFQESLTKASTRVSKDTPLMGRKRVSRITEEDKENDDAQAQEQCPPKSRDTPSVDKKEKKRTLSEKRDNADKEVTAQEPQLQVDRGVKGSEKENFQVTNKIKLMYLKRGAALKKHNLETIFESPKKRATGTPVNLLGGRKMKRTVAFTETPWLGRTGRTKGRKVKKGKQVKRVLSSKVEKSWKLDIRLSSLDEHSP